MRDSNDHERRVNGVTVDELPLENEPAKGQGEEPQEGKGPFGGSSRVNRVIFGAAYAIVNVACLFFGPIPTCVLIMVMSVLCCLEFLRMAQMRGRNPNAIIALCAAALYPLSALKTSMAYNVAVTFALFIGLGVWYVRTPRANISDVATTVFGPLYTGFMFTSIVLIRRVDAGLDGFLLAFAVMGSIWLSDAFAYAFGIRFGRHKMAPKISPKKSWEGFAAGVVGSALAWLILAIIGTRGISVPFALCTSVVVNVSGVFGDLFESRIKRGAGIKDSGNIIPGHGGMLDRSDSLLFGSVAAYIILQLGGII